MSGLAVFWTLPDTMGYQVPQARSHSWIVYQRRILLPLDALAILINAEPFPTRESCKFDLASS